MTRPRHRNDPPQPRGEKAAGSTTQLQQCRRPVRFERWLQLEFELPASNLQNLCGDHEMLVIPVVSARTSLVGGNSSGVGGGMEYCAPYKAH